MKPVSFNSEETINLKTLSAAAPGPSVGAIDVPNIDSTAETEETRSARIAELKAKFQAGTLIVDEKVLASKLVDSQLKSRPGSQK